MKRKAIPAEAAPLPTCTAVGPEDMVLVGCASGELFLVERNCAIVSSYCRDLLQVWEGAVRRVVAQYRCEDSTVSDSAAAEAIAMASFEPDSYGRYGGGPLATDPAEIPFMPFLGAGDISSLETVRHVPVTLVAEHYQQRLRAAEATTPTKVDRPSSKLISSYGDRKGVHMIVPKPITPLSPIENTDGALMYPVVIIPYVTPELMESALSYAHKKYKADVDGERPSVESAAPVTLVSAESRWRLMAASVLTGM
ncbi:hypothetical protein GH5_03889 [Leishmania sp. Ghana 2012 LV757]|uniref:hypothetical protein n=1 Tax=Leishmania sp. Ghana 2012 LV757 TaxID=2803181 RepID=UPI001B7A05A9|nr:hypothetical protein GH5_03889 [Leishmania sp. Ghana 2012 LV757]